MLDLRSAPAPELDLAALQAIADQLDGRAPADMHVGERDHAAADHLTRAKTGDGTVMISKRLLRRLLILAAKSLGAGTTGR